MLVETTKQHTTCFNNKNSLCFMVINIHVLVKSQGCIIKLADFPCMQMRKFNLVVTDLLPCRKNRQKNHISSGFGSDEGPHVSVHRGEMTTGISIYKAPFKGVITQLNL